LTRENDPSGDAADVEHLVASDQQDGEVGRMLAFFEIFDQPANWQASIDENVKQSEGDPANPSENEPEQHAVNASMDPRGWIMPAAAMAPALIIGLRGRPVPGSRLMALKASPVGSTLIFLNTSARVLSSSANP
jgi:hypothetical protein